MPINPSRFSTQNVADTCAIWNVLSSACLYSASLAAGCAFCCTGFVKYECLHKPRRSRSDHDAELQERLRRAQKQGSFQRYTLDLEDLQDVDILEERKRLGKGELSSIIFARKTRQAVLSDDQKARRLASELLGPKLAQTTPHLFAWLVYTKRLGDGDKATVIAQHEQVGRPLRPHFELAFLEALRCRSMS